MAPTRTTSRTPINNSRQDAGRNHRWRHHDRHWRNHHHHHPHYVNYYYGGYPFYGSPFGYGYGYGYGYPSFGVSFYSGGYTGGYRPYYAGTSYQRGGGGSVVSQVQQRLAQAGYYRGAIDGVIGDRTRSAIRAYERASGLPVDGRIDQALLSRLRVS